MRPWFGTMLLRLAAVVLVAIAVVACDERRPELTPMPATDTSKLEPAVRSRLAAAQAEFDRVAEHKPSNAELGNAYGELAMNYHAQDLAVPAEVAYLNAHELAPRDKRWPYLLAHLYADSSRLPEAIEMFEVVRNIDENDVPTQIYLGQLYFLTGDLDKASVMYERVQSHKDARAAALAGLGKIALARGRYTEAVDRLEEALKLSPAATRLRQPLAMAYRGLGETEKAEANLAHYAPNGDEPGVPDPVVDLLSSKVVVSRVLLRRGQRYGKEGRFDLAEQAYRAAVASDPTSAEAIANLGISLANLGHIAEAQERLTESLRMDDTNSLVHLSLGVVYDRQGFDKLAIEQYQSALERDPDSLQARVYLADAKMRTGSAAEAAQLYRQALDRSPDSSRMQFSLAMALVQARRQGEARKVLEAVLASQPQNAEIINTLARLLATAADPKIRDGARALTLSKALFESTRSLAVGQTYAMAFAETGNFTEAVKLQQETIIGYERSGAPVDKSFLTRNLLLYQRHQPSREGWPAGDPAFQPRSPAAARLTGGSPAS
jgi:tetratricopeptide (TPR) repeat protein